MTDFVYGHDLDFTCFKPEQIELFREKAKEYVKQIKKNKRKSFDTTVCDPDECTDFGVNVSCRNCCRSDVWGIRYFVLNRNIIQLE